MAAIALQDGTLQATDVAFAAANAGGDTVKAGFNGLPVVLLVRNTDAAAKTVTVQGRAWVVAATTGFKVIPISQIYANQDVAVTYSAVTNVTVAAVALTPVGGANGGIG